MSYKLAGLNSLAAAAMLYFSVMILYSDTVSDKYPGFTGTPYVSQARSSSRTVTRSLSGEVQPEIGVSIPIGSAEAAEAESGGEKRGASAVESRSPERDPSPAKKTALARVKEETEESVVHSGEHLGQTTEEVRNTLNVKTENFVKDGLGQ